MDRRDPPYRHGRLEVDDAEAELFPQRLGSPTEVLPPPLRCDSGTGSSVGRDEGADDVDYDAQSGCAGRSRQLLVRGLTFFALLAAAAAAVHAGASADAIAASSATAASAPVALDEVYRPASPPDAAGRPGRPLAPASGGGDAGGAGQPRYARVDGSIETLWQRPAGEPKGVFFIAHGCMHQGPDVFAEFSPDGSKFRGCERSYFGRCLGLPEEARLRDAALARGYLVLAVSGGSGRQSCWRGGDAARVAAAVRHVLRVEGLPEDTPVLASGASSGGELVAMLAMPDGLPHLKCIVLQVSRADSLRWGSAGRRIPTLFVHMPRDGYTAELVEEDFAALKKAGIRTAKIEVHPGKVTASFLSACIDVDVGKDIELALRKAGVVDSHGFLKEDARGRSWVAPVRQAIDGRSDDSLEADESCIAERMNVAWALHEFTAQYAEEMLDFCEGRGRFATSSPPR